MFFLPQGHTWLKDDEATHCKQCEKEFSISRRKVCGVALHLLAQGLSWYLAWALVLEKARRSRPAALGSCSPVCWQMTSQPAPLQGPQPISTGLVSTTVLSVIWELGLLVCGSGLGVCV